MSRLANRRRRQPRRSARNSSRSGQQLEHVARVATLGELTATLTHELAQPLAAILANSSVGIDLLDAPEPDLQEVRATLSDICADTERAGEIIRGLREMLKRDTPGFTSVDLNQLIRDVERIAHGDAVAHQVTVRTRPVARRPPGQGRQRSASAGHAEPDAQRLQRHG